MCAVAFTCRKSRKPIVVDIAPDCTKSKKAKKRSDRNSESQQTARQKLSTSNSRSIKNVDRRRATLRRGIKYKANNNKSNNKRNITQCKKVYFAFILAFRQHLYGQHGGQYRQMVEA